VGCYQSKSHSREDRHNIPALLQFRGLVKFLNAELRGLSPGYYATTPQPVGWNSNSVLLLNGERPPKPDPVNRRPPTARRFYPLFSLPIPSTHPLSKNFQYQQVLRRQSSVVILGPAQLDLQLISGTGKKWSRACSSASYRGTGHRYSSTC
jgi:hypothetical protein